MRISDWSSDVCSSDLIETAQEYGTLNHGEAVAIGMVLAARLSTALGMATDTDTMILRALLQRFGLPTTLLNGLDPDALPAHIHLDQKAQARGLRFVLWDGLGRYRQRKRLNSSH